VLAARAPEEILAINNVSKRGAPVPQGRHKPARSGLERRAHPTFWAARKRAQKREGGGTRLILAPQKTDPPFRKGGAPTKSSGLPTNDVGTT
jgi:hypothetical protein